MAWQDARMLVGGVALSLGAWLVGCGGVTTDDVVGSGTTAGGSGGSGVGGSNAGGTSSGGTSSGGSSAGTNTGGTGVSGGPGGVGGGGASGGPGGGGIGGTGVGGGAPCPAEIPENNTPCSTALPICSYDQGTPGCPASTECECQNGGFWFCESFQAPCLPPCQEPALAGAFCEVEGVTCGDACNNSCLCNNGKWFCDGPCDPEVCAPGAKCSPGEGCGTISPDGCQLSCECGPGGAYQCKEFCDPGSCTQGAKCSPGQACGTEGPDGCSTSCYCTDAGSFQCKTVCGQICPGGPQPCGGLCSGFEGINCTCFDEGIAVPCTCAPSPGGSLWQCGNQPPPVCQQGAKCEGFPCSSETPDGCKNYCECNFNGTYDCKKDCPGGACAPGASCSPGTGCAVPQGPPGCTLSCTCSPAGLYQCAASCEGGNKCPEMMPPPGSPCPPDGPQECKFDDGSFCFCNMGGWVCASP